MRKSIYALLAIMMVASLALAACQPKPTPAPTEEPAEAPAAEPTEAPAAEPAEAPTEEAMLPEGCNEDLTGEHLVYYVQAGVTGPIAAALGTSFVNAYDDAVATINEQGGICGAELSWDLIDTQYDAPQELAAYEVRRALDPKPISVATYNSAATVALADLVTEDKIVNFALGLESHAIYVPRNGYTVGIAPIYSDQFAGFLKWASENWDDIKPEGSGDDIVVGVLGWVGSFGASATTPESLAYAESLGITVLPLETFAVSAEADAATPLQNLALQGANVIYLQTESFGSAQAIGAMRALDLWDKVVPGGCAWNMNSDVVAFLGDSQGAMDGFYSAFPLRWWTDDLPGVQQVLASFEAGGYSKADKGIVHMVAYSSIFAWVDIVKHAVNLYGYENLTGETFMQAFQDLGTVNALDVFTYDVRGENRAPNQAQMRQAQLIDGEIQFVPIEDDFFQLPDTRPPAE